MEIHLCVTQDDGTHNLSQKFLRLMRLSISFVAIKIFLYSSWHVIALNLHTSPDIEAYTSAGSRIQTQTHLKLECERVVVVADNGQHVFWRQWLAKVGCIPRIDFWRKVSDNGTDVDK